MHNKKQKLLHETKWGEKSFNLSQIRFGVIMKQAICRERKTVRTFSAKSHWKLEMNYAHRHATFYIHAADLPDNETCTHFYAIASDFTI